MGWHEWPLMLFTVLGQIAAGGFIVLGLALISGRMDAVQRQQILRGMFFIWVLMGVGILASVMHLGSPLRAFNSLNRVGSSGLSNEILIASLFFGAGGIYWLLSIMDKMPAGIGSAWLAIAMVLALGFVYSIAKVYQIETVPTWNNGYTTVNFFMTMLIGGPLLGYLLKRPACACGGGVLAAVSLAALVVSVCSNLMQGSELAMIRSSVMQASTLSPDYGCLMALRVVLVSLGLGLWVVPMLRGKAASTGLLVAGLLLVIAGEIVGRGVFYGLHMTVGMTYGG